jgi:hypothetical protein
MAKSSLQMAKALAIRESTHSQSMRTLNSIRTPGKHTQITQLA